MLNFVKLPIRRDGVTLKVAAGHFVTAHSHTNYYINVSSQKIKLREANAVAKAMAKDYVNTTMVDTIVCLDNMQVIGACLASELTKDGLRSINADQNICILTPEMNSRSQLYFRENLQPAIRGKHVLILMASVATGMTVTKSMECVQYYGGIIAGVSSIYSAADRAADGTPIHALYRLADLPDYACYPTHDCPMCRRGERIDALITGNGYSSL